MIERSHDWSATTNNSYDKLRPDTFDAPMGADSHNRTFQPNKAYDDYFKIHKVFVNNSGGARLQQIGEQLKSEWLPGYLNAAGWALAESALTQTAQHSSERMGLLDNANDCWERALQSQHQLDAQEHADWLSDYAESFRLALNLAYAPLMQSIIAGDVTRATRERTFEDTLAIAQLSATQLSLANSEGSVEAIGDHLGFQYECNALLSLLYLDNANYVPIPSSARAGSGYDYRNQTHDISLIHQRWGRIHKITPIEIKSKASLADRRRYQALIVRGKMHLSVEGKYQPRDTTDAFAAVFEGSPTSEDLRIAEHASSTMKDLIILYQKGQEIENFKTIHSSTIYQDKNRVTEKYVELSSTPRS